MLYHAKNGTLTIGSSRMDYIRFGSGAKTLILLPGLGDGLRSLKGTALPMALLYRKFTKEYTAYAFSRRDPIPEGYSTRDMAKDQKYAMDLLNIRQADLVGVSMGGMIAQHLAADYPEKVRKLVLVVTSARSNPLQTQSIRHWMEIAQQGDYTALMDDNLKLIYSPNYYQKNRWLVPVMGKLTKPKSYERFLIQAQACLSHNSLESLERIQAPTFVIGGEQDQVLGFEPSLELAERIPNATLKCYSQWGHSLYEEEKGFKQTVLDFLREE